MTGQRAPLVLIADDVEDSREMYAEYLRYLGFETVSAIDGAEAIDKARELKPDVILLDLTMPNVDGRTACGLLKNAPGTRHIPIIVITGYALRQDGVRAEAPQCDAYLVKPVLPEDAASAIRRVLARGRTTTGGDP
jgi:CheY-like chemotaxis protein